MTAPTAETGFTIDSIKALMDGFDPAELLPELDSVLGKTELICRIAVMIGPLVLLVLGIAYLLAAPKEANHYFGYQTYFGMGSVNAWRYTQRAAGVVLGALGMVLSVIMLLLSGSFSGMDAMDMVWKALRCLGWQAGLALAANLCINLLVMVTYNSKGELRRRR